MCDSSPTFDNQIIFTCGLDNAKRSFYRAFNAVFGKVANVASESRCYWTFFKD